MGSRVITWIFLLAVAAAPAAAAPTARFTARPIQGTTCVAPCAVHFDAIGQGALSPTPYVTPETTDPAYPRAFHSLLFVWDFGEPNAGTWPHSGVNKNTATGGIAGHTYRNPGTYTVTLRVTNPAGEVNTTTRTVTVTDPATAFTAANTFCFANDDSNWTGCPLNCATDDNCTVTSNALQLFTAGDNCVGNDDCANADAGARRILLRRGSTFSATTSVDLGHFTTPGLIQAFGSGARPVMNMNGASIGEGSGWTWSDVDRLNPGYGLFMKNNSNNLTFYNVTINGYRQFCFIEDIAQPNLLGRLHAFIDMDCVGGANTSYSIWPGARYVLWMGGTIDKNNGGESTLRGNHFQHYLIQHTRWLNSAPQREHWQFRVFDAFTGMNAAQQSLRYLLVSDNVQNLKSNSSVGMRICSDSGCNCINGVGPSGCGPGGAAESGNIVDVGDVIFERNLFRFEPGTPSGHTVLVDYQGGDFTFRNNVIDYGSSLTSGESHLLWAAGETAKVSGGSRSSGISVYNNTMYASNGGSTAYRMAQSMRMNGSTGCTGDCFERNNLIVLTNGGNSSLLPSPGFVSSNSLMVKSDPFVGTMPAPGTSQMANFALTSPNATLINAGFNLLSASSSRESTIFGDALGGCRGSATAGPWDIGAVEFGAAPCSAGGGVTPPPAALQPPMLLAP
jgi:PKD repeat protein